MLLAHGVRDTTVGDYHTVRLAAKLRENGVPVTERHYSRLMHAPVILGLTTVLRPVLPVYADVRAFLETAV
jgi:acetyl esterase/lipase